MAKYRKKPVVVDAMQFTDATKNQCLNWVGGSRYADWDENGLACLVFQTIHGDNAIARLGDWIIQEPDGACCYPCKPDIFEATYEKVEDSNG